MCRSFAHSKNKEKMMSKGYRNIFVGIGCALVLTLGVMALSATAGNPLFGVAADSETAGIETEGGLKVSVGYESSLYSGKTAVSYTAGNGLRIYLAFDKDLSDGMTGDILAAASAASAELRDCVKNNIYFNNVSLGNLAEEYPGGVEAYVGRLTTGYLTTFRYDVLEIVFVRPYFGANNFPAEEDVMVIGGEKTYMPTGDKNKVLIKAGFAAHDGTRLKEDAALRMISGILVADESPVRAETLTVSNAYYLEDETLHIAFSEDLSEFEDLNYINGDTWWIAKQSQDSEGLEKGNFVCYDGARGVTSVLSTTLKYGIDRLVSIDGKSLYEILKQFGKDKNIDIIVHVRKNELVVMVPPTTKIQDIFDPAKSHTVTVKAGFVSGKGNKLADDFTYEYIGVGGEEARDDPSYTEGCGSALIGDRLGTVGVILGTAGIFVVCVSLKRSKSKRGN
jgi:hypothetical protein